MAGVSSRQKYPLAQFNEPRPFIVAGSFEVDGTNEPVNVRGRGFDVTYQATGEYLITFPDKYPQMVSCVASTEGNAEVDAYIEIDGYVASTGVLTLRAQDAADNAVEVDDGSRINFIAVFQLNNELAKTWNP